MRFSVYVRLHWGYAAIWHLICKASRLLCPSASIAFHVPYPYNSAGSTVEPKTFTSRRMGELRFKWKRATSLLLDLKSMSKSLFICIAYLNRCSYLQLVWLIIEFNVKLKAVHVPHLLGSNVDYKLKCFGLLLSTSNRFCTLSVLCKEYEVIYKWR